MIPSPALRAVVAFGAVSMCRPAAAAPEISGVRHSPALPGPADAVTVEARAPGATTATLRWREDGAAAFQTVPFFDADGDGDPEATIPPRTANTVVEFFIEAADSGGNTTWPPGSTGALWQTLPGPPGSHRPGAQPVHRAVLRAADLAALTATPGDTAFSGTLITTGGTGTLVHHLCSFRAENEGPSPQSFRVAFPAGDPWNGRTTIRFSSRFPHLQTLGAALWTRAGLPVPEVVPVQLRLNENNPAAAGAPVFGSYARVDVPDAAWLTRQFPGDAGGNLYAVSDEGPGTHGELAAETPATAANYAESYHKLTNAAAADYADIIALTQTLSGPPSSMYRQQLTGAMSPDQWLTYFALDTLAGNVRPGLQSGQARDFLLYRGTARPRFLLVPGPLDTILGNGENGTADPSTRGLFTYDGIQGLEPLMNHPDILPDYCATLLRLTNTVFAPEAVSPLVDQLTGGWIDTGTQQAIKEFAAARRAWVLSQIPRTYALNVSTGAPDVEDMKHTTDGSAEFSGTFDVSRVRSIRVNGLAAALHHRPSGPHAAGAWTCAISAASGVLKPGVTTVTVKFYDGQGGTGTVVHELSAAVYHSGGAGTEVSGYLGSSQPQVLLTYGSFNPLRDGSVWRYLADGSNPGALWKNEDFDDNAWSSGPSQLGYGDSPRDEVTRITRVDHDPAETGTQSAPAAYFRTTVNIPNAAAVASLPAEIKYDDGAVVYVNGTEVFRSPNLAPDAGHDDWADFEDAPTEENETARFTIPLPLIHDGGNTIAVRMHQHDEESTDLSFDLKLEAITVPAEPLIQWTAANSPYRLTEDTIVPSGVTLVIDPGVNVFAASGARLIVRGKIRALGTPDARIRFSNIPGATPEVDPRDPEDSVGPPKWHGILIEDSLSPDNVIRYADFLNAQPEAVEGCVTVVRSECLVEHCSFRLTFLHGVYGKNCSLTVQDCYFPGVFPPGKEYYGEELDNLSEFVEVDSPDNDPAVVNNPAFLDGFPVGGHLRLYRNVFEGSAGHNDLVDVTAGKWGVTPVFDVQDNRFLGPSGDEHLDLNGDAYIAGNYFQDCTKDIYTSDHGYANAVSADAGGDETTVVIARNVFTHLDHGVNVKQGVGAIFEHNTLADLYQDYIFTRNAGEEDEFVQGVKTSAVNCFIPDDDGPAPGDGAYVAYNLFYGSVPVGGGAVAGFPRIFSWADMDVPEEPPFTTRIEMRHNFLDPAMLDPVTGAAHPDNVFSPAWQPRTGDPLFVDRAARNFALRAHSPARGTAPHGLDYGATIPAGCYLSALPAILTPETGAAITVGGPGIFAFKWRLNIGAWSEPVVIAPGVFSLTTPTIRTAILTLPALADGQYYLEVIGQDFAGNWQTGPSVASWTVKANLEDLQLSEITVHSGPATDTVELHNAGSGGLALTGWSLTDDQEVPGKFPLTGSIPAGGRLTLDLTGLDLSTRGGALHLFRSGKVTFIDSVAFGPQIGGFSIGRTGRAEVWTLCTPTPNASNIPVTTGPLDTLRLNEWLAIPAAPGASPWLELANTGALPVSLTGVILTNNRAGGPDGFIFPALSFISGQSCLQVFTGNGPASLPFAPGTEGGCLTLIDPSGATGAFLDQVSWLNQSAGVSMGRDTTGKLVFFTTPTGGAANSTVSPSAYQSWLTGHGITGDTGDDDRDGMNAFMEYALGGDPFIADSEIRQFRTTGNDSQFSIALPAPPGAPQEHGVAEVTYTLQVSEDLSSEGNWTTLAVKTPASPWTGQATVIPGTAVNGLVPLTIIDTPAPPAPAKRFLRLLMRWTP